MNLYVKRKFAAAHYLPNYPGPCAGMHGHTWVVEIWITGPVDPETGMVVDFSSIKTTIDLLDHGTLNDVLPNPTAENLVSYLLDWIPLATKIRVWESENAYAESERE